MNSWQRHKIMNPNQYRKQREKLLLSSGEKIRLVKFGRFIGQLEAKNGKLTIEEIEQRAKSFGLSLK